MPRVDRSAHVTWQGSSARGTGTLSADTGAFSELPYREPTRVGAPDGQTSPEELLAAAHAGCYAMSLAAELTRAKAPPERLDVTARVTLDEVPGEGHRITHSSLSVRVRAPVDGDMLDRLVDDADRGCTFSALIKASAVVTIEVSLDREETG